MDKTLTTEAPQPPAEPGSGGTALTVVAPQTSRSQNRPLHRPANFLAHLIAIKDGHPQTRDKRRAEPAAAISAYRKVMTSKPV